VIFKRSQEPKKAAMTAGIPNLIKTALSAFLPTKNNLKILLKKWTTPVRAMAKSTGKNTINTGVSIVPKPNPEKKVRMAAKKAVRAMIKISMGILRKNNLERSGKTAKPSRILDSKIQIPPIPFIYKPDLVPLQYVSNLNLNLTL
jgi:hypothetical protein